MTRQLQWRGAFAWLTFGLLALGLTGCPAADRGSKAPASKPSAPVAEKKSAAEKTPEIAPNQSPAPDAAPEQPSKPAEAADAEADRRGEKARDLGKPLVDNVEKLRALAPDVWLDLENKYVIFLGEVCRADYPLEFLVTYRDRAYEAIITSNVKPSVGHAGLLALGAEPGKPVQFEPEFAPPTGTEVAIELRWKGADGKVQSAPAQEWVRNVQTKKPLEVNWVFAGSKMWKDQAAGTERYMADFGEFICLLNLTTAMLDLPIRSQSALESRLFEANLERLPPTGTPVTLLLKPKVKKAE